MSHRRRVQAVMAWMLLAGAASGRAGAQVTADSSETPVEPTAPRPRRFGLSVLRGVTIPMARLGLAYTTGRSFVAGVTFTPHRAPRVALRAELLREHFAGRDNIVDQHANGYAAGVLLRLHDPARLVRRTRRVPVGPYIVGGVGYRTFSTFTPIVAPVRGGSTHLGAGVELDLGQGVRLLVEVRVVQASGYERVRWVPAAIGLRF